MRAAAALGATVVLGGLSTAGPAVLEAEGAAVAAAATSAVLLGTAASAATQTKKKTDVRSNIITFKTAVAPATKTHTKVIARTAPPARGAAGEAPGGGAKKTKPRWSSGDAPKDTAAWKPAAARARGGRPRRASARRKHHHRGRTESEERFFGEARRAPSAAAPPARRRFQGADVRGARRGAPRDPRDGL